MLTAAECPGNLALVDDADDFRRATCTALEGAGYRVNGFASAEALLAALDGGSPGIDLFIVDLRLPGLQGQDLVRSLRRRDPSCRVLMISGSLVDGNEENLGVGPVLEKPFRVADLLQRCQILLRS